MSALVSVGPYLVGAGQPYLLIAGNCVVESDEIARRTADRLMELCLDRPFNPVFKASFDKANRTRGDSYRGPGLEKGLAALARIKADTGLPILTDVHLPEHCAPAAEVADILQIPAFLCRQTDLLEAAAKTSATVNVKKGQFVSPDAMQYAVKKVHEMGNPSCLLTERGTTFGYGDLIVDYRGFDRLRRFAPLIFDATHSAQKPAGSGGVTGGDRRIALPLARAAAAVGIDGLFMEVHPRPEEALSDSANTLDFDLFARLLEQVERLRAAR
jgi:2-dehydro-3-deoxyphosphooctonate aldolase (KDO 8-P synthase)